MFPVWTSIFGVLLRNDLSFLGILFFLSVGLSQSAGLYKELHEKYSIYRQNTLHGF